MQSPSFSIPPDVQTLLKGAKNVAPQIGKIKLPFGGIVALATLAPMVDALAEAQIQRHTDRKTKKKKNDGTRVIKVSDAIDCVDKFLRDPKILLQLAKDIVSVVLDPGGLTLDPTAEIVICFREKMLRQSTPRTEVRNSKIGRPAKGHGRGRK